MKKLLICSHAYVSPENLIKPQLLTDHFDVALVVPKKWSAMGRDLKSNMSNPIYFRVFPTRVAFPGNGGKYFYCTVQLFLAFLKFRPHVVYVEEEPWTPAAFELILFSKLFRVKKKVIFSWENLNLELAGWQKFIKKFVLSNVDLVIAGNREAKDLLEISLKKLGKNSIPVYTNAQFGVDTSHFSPRRDVACYVSTDKSFIIGFVGRFVPSKGIDTLIESLQFLPKECELLLVSTTHLPEEFTKLAEKLKVKNRIKVVEGKPHQELPKYLQQMNIFVLPSKTTLTWKEQFGRVIIEAMAVGLPVIGSSSGAIPEVIGDAGLVFKEGNAKELAEKILLIKKSAKLQKELSEKSLKRVAQKYTHEKVVKRLVDLLTNE